MEKRKYLIVGFEISQTRRMYEDYDFRNEYILKHYPLFTKEMRKAIESVIKLQNPKQPMDKICMIWLMGNHFSMYTKSKLFKRIENKSNLIMRGDRLFS